jgi:methyl-accepting chemotaxis protein
MKIANRLNIILSGVILVLFLIFGAYSYTLLKNHSIEDVDVRMFEQVKDLRKIVRSETNSSQRRVNLGSSFLKQNMKDLGEIQVIEDELVSIEAENQLTHQKQTIEVPSWYLDGEKVQFNKELIDEIGNNDKNYIISIYQKTPVGYVRIATNIKKSDGELAVGTYISNDSQIFEKINKGNDYKGRVFIVDDWYLAAYTPVKINGEIQGMLCFAAKENLQTLKEIMKSRTYYKHGYTYLVGSDGEVLMHKTDIGVNVAKQNYFKEIVKTEKAPNKIAITKGKEHKILYFDYTDDIDAYIIVTVYNKDIMAAANNIGVAIIIIMFISIGLFMLINSLISRNISSGLNKSVALTTAITEGNLNQNININQKDEIGALAKALTQMSDKLKEVITTIKTGSLNIASASQQLSATSEQISQGASSQAASFEEVSSSMEEMTSNIQQNAKNAMQTEKIAMNAAESIKVGYESSVNAEESMKEIANKIMIINDIAFQTNILALNAAVEAARAGEHGKGFAVVATEVRKLAERSKLAAEEIGLLSKNGVDIAQKAGEQLGSVVPEIDRIAKLVQEITAASNEQNTTADQINKAIQSLSNVTQQNAASSEEMAASSKEMELRAEEQNQIVSFFRIKELDDIDLNTNTLFNRDAK